jgi:hypothetical protein
MTARVALTYRDYAALPDDGKRYEIHDGELAAMETPTPQHQIVSANLFTVLDAHVRPRALGLVLYAPLDVILVDTTVLQPDLVYLDPERLSAGSRRGVEGPPTWSSKSSRPRPPPPTGPRSVGSTRATAYPTSGSSTPTRAWSNRTYFVAESTRRPCALPERRRSICRRSPTSASSRLRSGRNTA